MSQEKSTRELPDQLGGPRLLSLSDTFLLLGSGLLKSVEGQTDLPRPRVTAPLTQPHPRLGFYFLPTSKSWGDLQRLLCRLFHSLSSLLSMSLMEGRILLFLFFNIFVLSPSSVCFQRCCWADGQGRDLSAHLAQGSEKGMPRARGDQLQYCTSWPVARECVQ